MQVARAGARVVLVGIPPTTAPRSVQGSRAARASPSCMARRMNAVYPRAIRLVERGLVDVDSLVTHRYPLADVEAAFAVAAARTGLKVMVEP